MTTLRVASELAAVLIPIGYVGAAIAVICAIVAGIAIARGAGGLTGGAVGVWIVGALLSVTASFGSQWLALIISGSALVLMLTIGGVVRGMVGAAGLTRRSEAPAEALPVAAAPAKTGTPKVAAVVKAATSSTPTSPVAVVS
ncbi:hypothetical protein [Microbacterium sp. K35]|uniref:hypothetical protein n=1 Tax=Microbacterium sp. K35 TaxID=2305440 RepID=UPI00109BAD48|nr:hypothetical protein [Microbacterium sp. K35]